jgi:beta-phosphoglucomutase
MYLSAMGRFGFAPSECLIVEDNENGIRAAKASGGHLLVVRDVVDTNIENILSRIAEIEQQEVQ